MGRLQKGVGLFVLSVEGRVDSISSDGVSSHFISLPRSCAQPLPPSLPPSATAPCFTLFGPIPVPGTRV